MTKYNSRFLLIVVISFFLVGCFPFTKGAKNYEEILPMLDNVAGKAQQAVVEGYYKSGGERAVLDYIRETNPRVLNWFTDQNYCVRVKEIAKHAVVLVCDEDKPIFEDTDCNPGPPDKDHRSNKMLKSCEITMTEDEVNIICN